jgi:hypothetical protein
MSKPPPLTDTQRNRLSILEPALRNAVALGDYDSAKRLVLDIQNLLRPTGHETRLMQAKNWLFQAAMESGRLEIAIQGFTGIRRKVAPTTRIYLEATALLAICHLRKQEITKAEPFIAEALQRNSNIKSERRLRQFRRRLIKRFEEETVLAALSGQDEVSLDAATIQADAGTVIQTKSEDEIYADVGTVIPRQAIELLLRVHEFSRKQLPPSDMKLLAPPQKVVEKGELGRTVMSAVKRAIWKALCDPENEVYKIWFEQGMKGLLNQKVLTTAIISACAGLRVGVYTLVVSAVALVLKTGLDAFCEVSRPEGIMIHTSEK